MTAKEWLEQVREADEEIERLRHAVLDTWLQLTRTTPSFTAAAVQSTPEPHRYDAVAILDEAVYDRIRDLSAMKAQAVRVICALPDPRQRQVLLAYYVDCRDRFGEKKTWEAVAVEVHMAYPTLFRIRGAALAALDAKNEIE